MSKILLTLPEGETCCTGKLISFKAPAGSDTITAISIGGIDYIVCDSKGNSLCSQVGAWSSNSIVSVVLDCDTHKAYAQNSISKDVLSKFESELVPISTEYVESLFS